MDAPVFVIGHATLFSLWGPHVSRIALRVAFPQQLFGENARINDS
jgi:hypothetical protein